jgi:CheY-like chemotaxis protein
LALPVSKAESSAGAPHFCAILVVEDNITNQMIAATFLRNAGHQVDVAENGEEAIAYVQKRKYDLVFMDVSMPIMDGLAATKAIRALGGSYEHLPILAMTAHAMRGNREECLKAGMNGYLTKPTTRDTLLQAVQHWAGSPRDADKDLDNRNNTPMQPILQAPCTENTDLPPENSEIGEEALHQLFNDLGRDGFIRYAIIFQADITKVGRNMILAADKGDWAAVQLHAHSIKSSVLNFGLAKLSGLAEKIEAECEQNHKADIDLVREFPSAWTMALRALNVHFASLGLPAL